MPHSLRTHGILLIFTFALFASAIPTAHALPNVSSLANQQHMPAAVADQRWDGRFGLPGVSGTVNAIAVDGQDVYVAGQFTSAGGVPANSVARWNAQTDQWSALGDGLTGEVFALALHDGDVYAGGTFTQAGSLIVNHVARWHANAWSALGAGVSGCQIFCIKSILVDGDSVWVGGDFTSAGNTSAKVLARWNGQTWSMVDNPFHWLVYALVHDAHSILAGGDIGVQIWNGQQWAALGNGPGLYVTAIAVNGSTVYATTMRSAFKFDGVSWTEMSNGLYRQYRYDPTSLAGIAILGAEIYLSGFLQLDEDSSIGVARWDGQRWRSLGGLGFCGYECGNALVSTGHELFVGGEFTSVGKIGAARIARWSEGTWHTLGHGTQLGMNEEVTSIVAVDSNVYVEGNFTRAGSMPIDGIARWDGEHWSSLGSGVRGAMMVSNHQLYVGGVYTPPGTPTTYRLARWDANHWTYLAPGLDGGGMWATADSNFYVEGDFTRARDGTVYHVAKWDGSAWVLSAPGIFDQSSYLLGFAVKGNDVYIGGHIATIDNLSVNGIARWDGRQWSALGAGISDSFILRVNTITLAGDQLYIGGDFAKVDGMLVHNVAQWNMSTQRWSALRDTAGAEGVDNEVWVISVRGSDVFIAGHFGSAGNTPVNNIVKWDGAHWSPIGGGLTNNVFWVNVLGLATDGGHVYAGGDFDTAAGRPSFYFAEWAEASHVFLPVLTRPH